MDNEIWCDIKGYEGLYQVSNMGRVKSLNYNHTGKERILSPYNNRNSGYLQIWLYKCGKPKRHYVHRLVLMTFNPNPDMENLDCNHLDEIKENNHLSNLQWTTRKENINHGTRTLRAAEKLSTPIVQLTIEGHYIMSYKSSHDAERIAGFTQQAIIQCCKNRYMREGNNIYKGFRWMYLSEFMDKHNGLLID